MFISRPLMAVLLLIGRGEAAKADELDAAALQTAIVQAADRYSDAFKDKDAGAIAELFTAEAEYVDATGTVFHGRKAIEAEFAASFAAGAGGLLGVEIISIRPIATGVVVEEGISKLRTDENAIPSLMRYTATHVRQPDGSWLLASVRELGPPPASPHDQLLSLAWLEGRWREEVGGTSTTTEWKRSNDGNFLISEFSVEDIQGVPLRGTHRIGWDAERKQFRSWVFDSSGGWAEGWWTPGDDGSWSVQLSGVDVAGARQASVLTYFRDGADGLVITQDQRIRGGVSLPAVTHRVLRQPPAPGKRAAR